MVYKCTHAALVQAPIIYEIDHCTAFGPMQHLPHDFNQFVSVFMLVCAGSYNVGFCEWLSFSAWWA